MKLAYNIQDRPKIPQLVVFAFQQLLAILAATIVVPMIINGNTAELGDGFASNMSQSAALFGAGIGTIVYLLFTKFKSPVFLGSSFAFLGSMSAAFAGGIAASRGYAGLIIGAVMAGLVYVIIAVIVKFAGVKWINKLMPAVVIGPTVSIIGLSLSVNAVKDAVDATSGTTVLDPALGAYTMNTHAWVYFVCALVTLFVVIICSVFGKKMMKLIMKTGNDALKVIDFSGFSSMQWIPDFTFVKAIRDGGFSLINGKYIATIAVAYIPVAFVVFAEHIADHKNLSSIIEKDLLEEPGLHRTLLGDGVGSMVGAFFCGCPNTTYGESIGCVAITGNASVITILATAILAIIASFFAPFVTFLATIPSCVMGGVCITLYGFIAVSGLKMIQKVNLDENKNLFVVSVILITGVGGLALNISGIKLTSIACALILGIITNLIVSRKKDAVQKETEKAE